MEHIRDRRAVYDTIASYLYQKYNGNPTIPPRAIRLPSVRLEGKVYRMVQPVDESKFVRVFSLIDDRYDVSKSTLALSMEDWRSRVRREGHELESTISNMKTRAEQHERSTWKRQWASMVKDDLPGHAKNFMSQHGTNVTTAMKIVRLCVKKVRRKSYIAEKAAMPSDAGIRARRFARDFLFFVRQETKAHQDEEKRVIREEEDRLRNEEEEREEKRQRKKLNFLLNQTEIFSHFMSKKMGLDLPSNPKGSTPDDPSSSQHANAGAIVTPDAKGAVNSGEEMEEEGGEGEKKKTEGDIGDEVDDEEDKLDKEAARKMAEEAIRSTARRKEEFDESIRQYMDPSDMQRIVDSNSRGFDDTDRAEMEEAGRAFTEPPKMFRGQLKPYQMKGVSWLISLYEQGINGILADEMGLGKTVQTVCFLSYLSEVKGIWGPFLIIAPTSTLHNWRQEIMRFCPHYKVLPYWGVEKERKILRQCWKPRSLYRKDAAIHVVVTSYRRVVNDEKHFQRVKWQYLILDEAHAIKSTRSQRWKTLLGFPGRNRLLLTGTPIQNNMAELWALLHFIMPTLFDDHEEFSSWFARNIESHADAKKKSSLDQHQLQRLHMILKPFMLRRIKKDVEREIAPKIELNIACGLTSRQQSLYSQLKKNLVVDMSESHLMNLVMQLRKVCNHPELFFQRDVSSPFFFGHTSPASDPTKVSATSTSRVLGEVLPIITTSGRNLVAFVLPKLVFDTFLGDFDAPHRKSSSSAFVPDLFQRHHMHFSDTFDLVRSPFLRRCTGMDMNFVVEMLHGDIIRASVLELYRSSQKSMRMLQEEIIFKKDDITLSRQTRRMYEELAPSLSDRVQSMRKHLTFLTHFLPSCVAPPVEFHCSSVRHRRMLDYSVEGIKRSYQGVLFGSFVPSHFMPWRVREGKFDFPQDGMFSCLSGSPGFSYIFPPDVTRLVADSGKMQELDRLLRELKAGGHRVLIFSQMTRMLDILEDYVLAKKYKCFRLDGSTPVELRRDMVHDFQTSKETFIFLLSTRAGGLGINLTAADTVIFYDHDWNPTMDEQATDRAHRIGQTKQVSVYHMVAARTIEERILQRAHEKHTIQKTVYSGSFKAEASALSGKDVKSLLFDED
eukprot:TRINITY_DN24069_c0_g1_i3.p1 TRINITY_DN24069_c0_g1~~TRINITY_DN24069_c0_g1_i3.p1  ORF type:complete len:1230 (-),score=366.03 TRINITY_DN24069_c0_g1_i3:357-3707(-)